MEQISLCKEPTRWTRLEPGPPDPEFEVLTARPHLPTDFFNGRKIKQKENARDSISSLEFYVHINCTLCFFVFEERGFGISCA